MKNNYSKSNLIFSIKIFFRIILIISLLGLFFLKAFKTLFFNYNNVYKDKFMNVVSQNNTLFYNIKNNFEENIFNNKITVINIVADNKIDLFENFKKNKTLLSSFGDKINILDLVIKEKSKEEDFFEGIINSMNNNFDNFIKVNKINNPVVYFNSLTTDSKKIILENKNKILIFDEKNNLKQIFDKNIKQNELKEKIIDISQKRKFLKKIEKQEEGYKFIDDEEFFTDLTHFVIFENKEDYDHPFFVILDSEKKQILLATINGAIFNIIELNSSCYPNNLKADKNFVYISDSCDGSIYKILLKENKIKLLVKSKELLNISDFEFINDENIFIVKDEVNSLITYNIKDNIFKKVVYEGKIGPISNVLKNEQLLYFFDYEQDTLYSYSIENEEIKLEIKLHIKDKNISIDYFSMSSKDNIYFLNKDFNRIFVYNDGDIKEKSFSSFLTSPKDLIIFRNYFYFLSDNFLQKIDFLTNAKETINLFFSKNYIFDINKIINEKIILDKQEVENIKNNNFKINLIYNNATFSKNSPSFLLLFRRENNKLFLVKKISFANDLNYLEIEDNLKTGDYILYGKIYYKNLDNNLIKIKKIKKNLKLIGNSKKDSINIII